MIKKKLLNRKQTSKNKKLEEQMMNEIKFVQKNRIPTESASKKIPGKTQKGLLNSKSIKKIRTPK